MGGEDDNVVTKPICTSLYRAVTVESILQQQQQQQQQRHPQAPAALFDVNGLVERLIAQQLSLLQCGCFLESDS